MTARILVSPSVRWSSIVALASAVVGLPAQEWRSTTLTPRAGALGFDPSRGCTVLYGGTGTDATWERRAAAWAQRSPAHTAGEHFARGGIVYDSTRARLVLFGTAGPGTVAGTAEYDGLDWVTNPTPIAPPPRVFGAFAFDSVRGCTVLFGGGVDNPRQMQNDTWEYGAGGWTQRAPSASPPGRWMHSLAFDASRGRCVLFGGNDGAARNDTWEYDGATWQQVPVANAPSPRFAHTTVADAARGRVVLFGGYGNGNLGDTWEYDGVGWQQMATVGAPPARSDHQATFDSGRGRTVVFGGFTAQGMAADTWEYDGLHWTQVANQAPAQRTGAAFVYDAARARAVLFGGLVGSAVVGDTWEHSGSGWQQQNLPLRPADRAFAVATYDHARQRTVLFGGVDLGRGWNDTWEFDGAAWTSVPTAHAPSARNSGMIGFDRARRRVVLFGGKEPALQNDTWEYDGVDWHSVATVHAPSPRCFGAMAYHLELGRTVLFGGSASSGLLGDTWEYDGVDWTQRPVAGPSARWQSTMAYDPIGGQVLLHAGQDLVSFGYLRDTWSYGRAGWQQLTVSGQPAGRVGGGLVYDLARSRAVLFGGVDAHVWELLPAAAPSWTRDGAGCAGVGPVPSLDAAPGSLPVLGGTCTLQLAALPGPAFLLFGFDLVQLNAQPLPIDLDPARPACQLWMAPLPGVGALLLPSGGNASFGLTLPAVPALAGTVLGTQAFVLDPAAAAGFALSNAGVLRAH